MAQRVVDGRGVRVGVPEGGDHAVGDEQLGQVPGTGQLRGEGHRPERPRRGGDEVGGQPEVRFQHPCGVLRPAPGRGQERALEVDPGDQPLPGERRQQRHGAQQVLP